MTVANLARGVLLPLTLALLAATPTWHEESVSVDVPAGAYGPRMVPAVKLYGTLTVPDGIGPLPVALIIAGSGPTDRDGNGPLLHTDAYKLLAHELASRGIATLRYDKRTIGQSVMPNVREQDLRFEEFWFDATRWMRSLGMDRRFSAVSIIGHSEGSLIGMQVVEALGPLVAAFVSLEGASRNAADVIPEQVRQSGAPQSAVATVTQISNSLRAGKTVATVDPSLAALFRASVQPYLISWFRYDPAAEIARLRIPILIVQGSTDIQVGVQDAQRLKSAAPSAKLVIINGMNHILRDAPPDRAANIATYNQPSLPLNAELVPAISNFILHPQ